MRLSLLFAASFAFLFSQALLAQNYSFTGSKTILIKKIEPVQGTVGEGIISFKNVASHDITLDYSLLKNAIKGTAVTFCDWIQCKYEIPANGSGSLPAGATGLLKFDVSPKDSFGKFKHGIDSLRFLLSEQGQGSADTLTWIVNFDTLTADYIRLGIPAVSGEEALKIYPNPASHLLYFTNASQLAGVSVFNFSGQMVFHASGQLNSLDVSHFDNGLFYIRLQDTKGRTSTASFLKSE